MKASLRTLSTQSTLFAISSLSLCWCEGLGASYVCVLDVMNLFGLARAVPVEVVAVPAVLLVTSEGARGSSRVVETLLVIIFFCFGGVDKHSEDFLLDV